MQVTLEQDYIPFKFIPFSSSAQPSCKWKDLTWIELFVGDNH